ncbi:MAG: Trimeric GatFAB AmidoTransferase(AdT) complex subunit [Ramalina farinacea]|uniref:Glutamyl-tRNA(Gln) amidotransferase subunit A, mitochondrial n=1 Tax=Ramalina farinacea TaxID=258253 RepID=A0AA43QKP3_9LECA|nr:Trimeric GatFAB AmidoTransferase(AdT) complex subunit [Ramalina farinacea]
MSSLLRQASRHVTNQVSLKALNAFITPPSVEGAFADELREEKVSPGDEGLSQSPIKGKVIAVKDNISTAEQATSCASALLDCYSSPFPATVVQRLKDAGAVVTGSTNMDEFGMGSDSMNSYFGPVKNAISHDLSAGGSSGGSAVAVATGQCHAALGTDTGGSVRLPAAYNGIIGFKPSYGMISRWGVVAYANSLDTVGILAKNTIEVGRVFAMARGYDSHDPTSLSEATRLMIEQKLGDHNSRKEARQTALHFGVPEEYNVQELQPAVRDAWICTLQRLQEAGHSVKPISLPATKIALSAYYVLAPAEASSNLAKYDGARYGRKTNNSRNTGDVLYSTTRGQGFGEEVRRRVLLGAFSLSAGAIDNYFKQAQKVRRLIQLDFNRAFLFQHPLMDSIDEGVSEADKVDFIISPTAQSTPPQLSELQHMDHVSSYSADVLTVPASLAGLPAISVPVSMVEEQASTGTESTPIGMQITGQYGTDSAVLSAAGMLESLFTKPR